MPPLAGVRVLDLSRVLAGPLCTQMLADHGADVIKVEPPTGDETRQLGPPFDAAGDAAYFSAINRGKRAISLDLTRQEGRAVLARLVAQCDVLIENFLPGTMERWSLGYGSLGEKHPRLVYCAISGFGADGPLGGLPGYDAVVQAMCGLMSVNGSKDSGPMRIGVPVVDHLTGYVACTAILMALYEREKTGRGQRVEATLFDTGLSLLVPHAANWFVSGTAPALLGSAHPNIAPYEKFRVGEHEIFLGVANDGQFRKLCECLGLAAVAHDERFATNAARVAHRPALRARLEEAFARHEPHALCRELMQRGVPAGPVNSIPDALTQAHADHRGMTVDIDGYRGVGPPARIGSARWRRTRRPPRFAEHTEEILSEAGYTRDEIALLRSTDVARREPSRR